MVTIRKSQGLRAAGETLLALEDSLKTLELGDDDQILVDGAAALARKIDTTSDDHLEMRYHAHYARSVAALSKRSDFNRDRRLADEAKAAAAAEAERGRQSDPLEQLRQRRVKDDIARDRGNRRDAAKIVKMADKGMTITEIAAAMRWAESLVTDTLREQRRIARKTG